MSEEERTKLLQEEIYPKIQEDVVEALVLGGELSEEQRVFLSALLMLVTSLQMQDKAKQGGIFVLKQYVAVSGLDWRAFMKAATATINTFRENDPRLKADNKETKEDTK